MLLSVIRIARNCVGHFLIEKKMKLFHLYNLDHPIKNNAEVCHTITCFLASKGRMKRLFLRSNYDKEDTATLDAIAVQEAEEEIRFDYSDSAERVREEVADIPITDSMVLNEMDLDYNAFLEEGDDDNELEGVVETLKDDAAERDTKEDTPTENKNGAHIELIHSKGKRPSDDALPIIIIPIDDDINEYCQCTDSLESAAMERLPEPLDEVEHFFSKHYVLSQMEREHIRLLQTELFGTATSSEARGKGWLPRWKSKQNSKKDQHDAALNRQQLRWKRLVAGPILWRSSGKVAWPTTIEEPKDTHCPSCHRPISTTLRPIWVRTTAATPDLGESHTDVLVECEVVLFTTGCLILLPEVTSMTDAVPEQMKKKIYGLVLWSEVEFIEPSRSELPSLTDPPKEPAYAFIQITTSLQLEENHQDESEGGHSASESSWKSTKTKDEPPRFTLLFKSTFQRDLCYRMVTASFLQFLTYQRAQEQLLRAKSHPTPDDDVASGEQLGWQYQYVYEPYFTLAVTNRLDLPTSTILLPNLNDGINQLDAYNGMAPLHYAIYYNHVPAIVTLLELGADSNAVDETNHYSPLDYCALHQSSVSTRELLQQHGATETTIKIKEPRTNDGNDMVSLQGELFGHVAGTEQVIRERREHREKVEHIMQEQKNNLQLLQQRGEQIETLSAGAANLNAQAQDYASMAKQLKQKMKQKQQNQWLPF
jgi:Ankyrin repeats (many copies)/Synaptobrevin